MISSNLERKLERDAQEELIMLNESPKPLPQEVNLLCYSCKDHPASHLCRYDDDVLLVQMCLCSNCMGLNETVLMETVLGVGA